VLSTIRHFRHEYEEHIRDRHCRAGVCAGLVRAPCLSACPAGVDVPGFVSLVGDKRYAEALRLHREKNPFASVCARVCFHTCEDKCRRASLDEPVAVRAIKRFMVDQEVTIQVPEVRENAANAARKIAVTARGPPGSPALTSWQGWAISRWSSSPNRGPAACWCRPSRPTGCRARNWRARCA
jgi:NADH-quinone oxidoreductase subunit F